MVWGQTDEAFRGIAQALRGVSGEAPGRQSRVIIKSNWLVTQICKYMRNKERKGEQNYLV